MMFASSASQRAQCILWTPTHSFFQCPSDAGGAQVAGHQSALWIRKRDQATFLKTVMHLGRLKKGTTGF